MDKASLRKIMREKRKSMDKVEKQKLDKILRLRLFQTKEYKEAKIVFIYVSTEEEINTIEIIKQLFLDGKVVAVPKIIKDKTMKALKIESFDELSGVGSFGILEPDEKAEDLSELVDLTIVPGLAFDAENKRLGYGGGFYDRFFEEYKESIKISLCYDYQFVTTVYPSEYDVSVEMIISNNHIVNRLKNQ
ncbi:MAG: 5-formyltetrahydrofolate cyclo-ligase [Sarcina sp.]